jgi:hypothetical protein
MPSTGMGLGLSLRGRRNNAFSIATVSGRTLTLDAKNLVLADAAQVTTFANTGSFGGSWAPGAAATRPLYRTNGIGIGKPSVDFDGVDDFLQGSTLGNYLSVSGWTIFAVVKLDGLAAEAASAYLNAAVLFDSITYAGLLVSNNGGTPQAIGYQHFGTPKVARATMPAAGTVVLMRSRYDGSNIRVSVNNGAETAVAAGDIVNTSGSMRVGSYGAGASFLDGGFGAIHAFNRNLSAAELSYVTSGLITEWGVT